MNPEVVRIEKDAIASAEVCGASVEAARMVSDTLLAELADPGSILYDVLSARTAQVPVEQRLGMSSALLVDPTRSGVVVARFQMQEGKMPVDTAGTDPEQMVTLWSIETQKDQVPPLRVPEGGSEATMGLADRLEMRGGGPLIYSREEVREVPVNKNTLLYIGGAARNANRERIQTALAIKEAHAEHKDPIVATVNPLRKLNEQERAAVKEFAPHARNEQELFIASAIDKGFVPAVESQYGSTFLPDGSSYIKLRHQEKGHEMIVLAPAQQKDEAGRLETGLFNGHKVLLDHGQEELGLPLEGRDVLYVTSTHYGTNAAVNNLLAVHKLRTNVSSFRVIGDNQPARNDRAHLIEIGLTLDTIGKAMADPTLRQYLLEAA